MGSVSSGQLAQPSPPLPPSAIALGSGSKGACASPEMNAGNGPGSGLFPWVSSSQIDLIKENRDYDEKTVEEAACNMGFEHRRSDLEEQESDGQRPKALVKLCLSLHPEPQLYPDITCWALLLLSSGPILRALDQSPWIWMGKQPHLYSLKFSIFFKCVLGNKSVISGSQDFCRQEKFQVFSCYILAVAAS